jgi:hypothetical protein
MRLALGQMNATIGDFAAYGAKIESFHFEPAEAPAAELRPGQTDRAEYERQQAAPGLRVSSKASGSGRRIPIAQVSKA